MPAPTREEVEDALRELDKPGARKAVATIRLYLLEMERPSLKKPLDSRRTLE